MVLLRKRSWFISPLNTQQEVLWLLHFWCYVVWLSSSLNPWLKCKCRSKNYIGAPFMLKKKKRKSMRLSFFFQCLVLSFLTQEQAHEIGWRISMQIWYRSHLLILCKTRRKKWGNELFYLSWSACRSTLSALSLQTSSIRNGKENIRGNQLFCKCSVFIIGKWKVWFDMFYGE